MAPRRSQVKPEDSSYSKKIKLACLKCKTGGDQ